MVLRGRIDSNLQRGGLFLQGVFQGLRGGLSTNAIRRSANRMGAIVLDEIQKASDRRFRNPTGALARSFSVRVRPRGGEFDVFVTTRKPYARIQDRGGVVRPKRGRALAVPLNAEAKALTRGGRAVRNIPGLHRRGRALFRKDRALFALVRQVRIPPTRYLQIALQNSRRRLKRELGRGIRTLSRGARRV